MRLGFFASQLGGSARYIVEEAAHGRLDVEPRVMISNNSGAEHSVGPVRPAWLVSTCSRRTHSDPQGLDIACLEALQSHDVDLVILSGFNRPIGTGVITAFPKSILNIHPAPLPRFGGKGMFGLNVHRAVINSGVTTSAITIHLVDQQYDHGPVIAQLSIPIESGDTPETLSTRLIVIEPRVFAGTIRLIVDGTISLGDATTLIELPTIPDN